MEVLLVIDMQQKYMKDYEPDLISRVNVRIQEAVSKNRPIIYVKNIGNPENEEKYVLADGLNVATKYVFKKKWPSAFSSKEFVNFVEDIGVDAFDVVGVDGRCCVAQTALEAKKRGYTTRLFLDSVAARSDNFYVKELPQMEEAGIEIIT